MPLPFKKKIGWIAFLADVVGLFLILLPIYRLTLKDGETVTSSYLCPLWEWASKNQDTSKTTIALVILGIAVVLFCLSYWRFILALKGKEEDEKSDRFDKNFVFGCFLSAAAAAMYGLMGVGIGHYIAMAIGLVFAGANIGLIVYHFKVLSAI